MPLVPPLKVAPATPEGQNVWGGTTFQAGSRFLVAMYFFLSAIGKMQSFDKETGGPYMSIFGPKMDMFLFGFKDMTGVPIPVDKAMYPQILLGLAMCEFLGGILFASDQRFGAWLLVMVTFFQSIVLHNFWDYQSHSAVMQNEMLHFHKNIAIIGGLLHYLATCPGTRHKNKFQRTMDALNAEKGTLAAAGRTTPVTTGPATAGSTDPINKDD